MSEPVGSRCKLNSLKFLVPLVFFIILSFLGAFLLHIIEEPRELQQSRALSDVDEEVKWDFWGSFSYILTVFTTIGPFHQPETTKGRFVTIAFAVLGISALLSMLQLSGKCIANVLISLNSCCQKTGHGSRPSSEWRKLSTEPSTTQHNPNVNIGAYNFPVWILLTELVAYIFIAPIFILMKEEAFERYDHRGHAEDTQERSITTYTDVLWYFLCAMLTIGFGGKAPLSMSYGLIVDIVLVIVAYLMLATILNVVHQKLDAIYCQLKASINHRYKHSLLSFAASGRMATETVAIKQSLRALLTEQPLCNRLWANFLSDTQYTSLIEHWKSKARLRNASMHTDDFNVAKLRMKPYLMVHRDRKSRDDVNSLIAMTDYLEPLKQSVV